MPTKKKKKAPAKSVAVVFGPGQLSPAIKKKMLAFQKKHHKNYVLPKMRARAAAEKKREDTLKHLKGIEIKDLRKAIMLGLSYEEAAYIAFDALNHLEIVKDPGYTEHGIDEEWTENLLRYLVKKNDHSIRFVAEEGRCGWVIDYGLKLKPYDSKHGHPIYIDYNVTERDHPDCDAEKDADTLNQFILDFYGIKEHADIKKTKKEIQAEIDSIHYEIKSKKDDIKDLTARLKKLKASL